MKNQKLIFTCLGIISIGLIVLIIGNNLEYKTNPKEVVSDQENERKMFSNGISMMLETSAGSGEYIEATDTTWAQAVAKGYIFNATMSKCENDSTLTWNETNKTVEFSGNVSDRCYVYFDKNLMFEEYIIHTYIEDGVDGLYYHDGEGVYGAYEAGDNSYRFTGTNYKLTSKASAYDNINDISETANGLIKMYCSSGTSDSYVGMNCPVIVNTRYYYLATDSETHYETYYEAAQAGIDKGYVDFNIKNYVCLGNDCANSDNIYRIIGVFYNDLYDEYNIKLIKNESIGYFQWGSGNNLWETSELKDYLNSEFLFSIEISLVSDIFKIGKVEFSDTKTAKEYYDEEMNGEILFGNGVGLMYVSDYRYAADPEYWETGVLSEAEVLNNWLNMNNGDAEWTITNSTDDFAFGIDSFGYDFTDYKGIELAVKCTP